MLCHIMLCHVMLCHVILCHVMLCRPLLSYFSPCCFNYHSSHIIITVHSYNFRSNVRNPVRALNAISRAMSMLRSKITDLDQNTVIKSVTDFNKVQNSDFEKNDRTQISVEMGESVYRGNGPMGIDSKRAGTDSELMILIK